MNKLIFTYVVPILAAFLLAGCSLNPTARSGMYGGSGTDDRPKDPPFDANAIDFGARWFPTHLRFAPDDSNFLASLCHVRRPTFCRIGRYTLATKTWDILPFEPLRTYRWPTYSPDGKWIVTTTSPCDDQYRCNPGDHVLVKMRPDGTGVEKVGKDVLAQKATFSGNGKKLIYWKRYAVPTPKGMEMLGKKEIYSMDWETGIETQLSVDFGGEEVEERPMLTPDGATVVFSGRPFTTVYRDAFRNIIVDAPPKVVGGENQGVQRWAFDVKDAPMSRQKAHEGKLRPIFSGQWTGFHNDMTLDGAILYSSGGNNRIAAGSQLPRSIECRQSTSRESGDFAVSLRKTTDGAEVEASFCIGSSSFTSVSNNKKHLIFINSGAELMVGGRSIFFVDAGSKEPVRIDWPRIELK